MSFFFLEQVSKHHFLTCIGSSTAVILTQVFMVSTHHAGPWAYFAAGINEKENLKQELNGS